MTVVPLKTSLKSESFPPPNQYVKTKPPFPELLYHTILRCTEDRPSGVPFVVFPLGTHTQLGAAKKQARTVLFQLGYHIDDFPDVELHTDTTEWRHGDGVMLWAKAFNNIEVEVGIETTINNEKLTEGPGYTVNVPHGSDHLHYVMRTTIDLNQDRSGAAQHSDIEGVYARRSDAILAANALLPECLALHTLSRNEVHDDLNKLEDWPYGEDVIVHATSQTGQNYYVTGPNRPKLAER